MNSYKYKLASNKFPKLNCPVCGAKKHWQRYFDVETGIALPEEYGRCDNEIKCGYELNPYQDKYHRCEIFRSSNKSTTKMEKSPGYSFIPEEAFEGTLGNYEINAFIQNLMQNIPFTFNRKVIERVIAMYYLGTIDRGYMRGAITFPFIDTDGKIRAVQVKHFDNINHTMNTNFLHSLLKRQYQEEGAPLPNWLSTYLQSDSKVSCLFGEHLLRKHPSNPIALVEAPKTAVVGTLYYGIPKSPEDYLWLAVYNLSSLTYKKCFALRGREVHLYPDLANDGHAYELWSKKAERLNEKIPGTRFIVSDLLEKNANANQRAEGLDLADFLIQQDWRDFKKPIIVSDVDAFIDLEGRLLIKTLFANTFTVYPSVDVYNNRSSLPEFEKCQNIDLSGYKKVYIDLQTLTIS